jgi:hypothetical protein
MTVSPIVVPNIFDVARSANTSLHVLRDKCDAAKVLGLVRCEKYEILVIYDGRPILLTCLVSDLFFIFY